MIVLRTPKGWTGPKEIDGKPVEGTWRSHQVPMGEVRTNAGTARSSRTWMRSYRPEELFDEHGALRAEIAALAPDGHAADERQPGRERRRAPARPRAARLPRLRRRRAEARRDDARRRPASSGTCLRDVIDRNRDDVPAVRAGRDGVEPARRRLRGHRPDVDGRDAPERRPPRARRPGHGGPVRAPVPGLAGGLPADRPARPVQLLRGVHPHRRLDVQPAREVAEGDPRPAVAAPDRVAQLPAQSSLVWRQDHNGFSTRTRASSTTWSTRRPT